MTTRSYVVKISVGEASSSRIWNTEKPFQVGHPVRWVMEQTATGVKIRNVSEEAQSLRSAPACLIKSSQLDDTVSLALPEVNNAASPFKVELRAVNSLPAAFETHPEEGRELRIYSCRDQWTLGVESLSGKFRAKAEDQKAFTLTQSGSGYVIKAQCDGLELQVPASSQKSKIILARGERKEFSSSALAGATAIFGSYQWRFDILNPSSVDSLNSVVEAESDAELKTLKKSFQYSLAAMALIALVGGFWPKSETPLAVKPQTTKILFAKKPKTVNGLMTAAPKGDKNSRDTSIGESGSKANSGRKGSEGKKRVAKASKAPSKKVAKATPRKAKSSASKRVAKSTPSKKKSSAVARKSTAKKRSNRGAVAKNQSGSALRNATKGLLNGGMSKLLKSSNYSSGTNSRAEAREMLKGGSGMAGRAAPSNGRVGTRSAHIAGFGGGGDGGPGSGGAGYGRGSHAKVSGQGKSFVSLDTSASDVDEGLTKDQVGRVIHAHMNEIRYCYEAAVLRTPDVEGKLAVRFSIGASGRVTQAKTARSSVRDGRLDDCIVDRLATWKFPRPKGGVTVAVTYPFIFKTLGR